MTIGEIDGVYQHLNLAILDMTDQTAFGGINPKDQATIQDFTILLDELSAYYSTGSGKVNDLDDEDSDNLVNFFDKLADYYFWGDGEDDKDADELFEIYDKLKFVFRGENSEFNMLTDEELMDLYDKIEEDEEFEFEYEEEMYYDWVDMLDMIELEKEEYQ